MATLNLARVRRLVRLYRQEVDGAATQLDELLSTRALDLTRLLDVSGLDVEVLRDHDDRVELFAQWVENARRRHAERRARDDHRRAERLAAALVCGRGYGPEVHVDHDKLDGLVACRSYDWLHFDPDVPTGLDRKLVRRIMRALEGTEVTCAMLWPDRLHLEYVTPYGRGRFDLTFQPVPRRRTVLYVPAFEVPQMRAAEEKAVVRPDPARVDSSQADEATGSEPTEPAQPPISTATEGAEPLPASAPARSARTGLRRFLEFASEALS